VDRPVRIAVVNDYEIVVAGMEHLLRNYPDQLEICARILIGEPLPVPVDVALYDLYGTAHGNSPALRKLTEHPDIGKVAVFGTDVTPDLIVDMNTAGAAGFISKALPGHEIAEALVRIARGERVVAAPVTEHFEQELAWPGKDAGLTERESQVLVLLARGLSNREIASAMYLSPETVKGYVSQAFVKLGVRNRVEATNFVHRSRDFIH
jgi:NarL family two-component system response regulator LiaR